LRISVVGKDVVADCLFQIADRTEGAAANPLTRDIGEPSFNRIRQTNPSFDERLVVLKLEHD
jgi:hypothetical protein